MNGLDWYWMGAARGIAGSREPEEPGCFLCRDEREVEWFVGMNNTDGPVGVWAVDDVDETALVEVNGHSYLPGSVSPAKLRLLRQGIARPEL